MVNKMTKWFYLEPFLFEKEALHLLDISRRLNENHTTVRKYLNNFTKEGVLKKFNKGRLTLYKLNLDFSLILDYLVIAEKEYLIYKCNQNKILKELVSDIQKVATKPVIIFGSSTKNFSNAKDIDIICLEDLRFLENKFNKEFDIIKVKSLNDINSALKQEVIKNHVIVYGIEEATKWIISNGV